MQYNVLYVLTVKCTTEKCEEDLECHMIRADDDKAIYTDDRAWKKSALMEIQVIEKEKREIIVRVPFVIKEAALIWVRECFTYIKMFSDRYEVKELAEAVDKEWLKILRPKHDITWFTGGKKVEEWREEMRSLAEKL